MVTHEPSHQLAHAPLRLTQEITLTTGEPTLSTTSREEEQQRRIAHIKSVLDMETNVNDGIDLSKVCSSGGSGGSIEGGSSISYR